VPGTLKKITQQAAGNWTQRDSKRQKTDCKTRADLKAYKKLIHVEQAFRVIKTHSLEIRPVFHHLDHRIQAHVFLCMLSYYLQWHMNQRLSDVYQNDGSGKNRRWTFLQVIERLKSIRSQTVRLGDTDLPNVISVPDEEQRMLLDALKIRL